MQLPGNQNKKTGKYDSRKIAYLGMFLALALILSYVESMIFVTPVIPGFKLGLANFFTVYLLEKGLGKEAWIIGVLRVLLSGFLFGNLFAIAYGLAGFLVSYFVMLMLERTKAFSPLGVSGAGGMFHNVAQLVLAMCLLQSLHLVSYLPILCIVGMLTGLFNGYLVLRLSRWF